MIQKYRSNGKLLLTGEYLVLDGALALALPTKPGQSLEVLPAEGKMTGWTALDKNGKPWLDFKFSLDQNSFQKENETSSNEAETTLLKILTAAHQMNQKVFGSGLNYIVTTMLEFEKEWGLGSSSTLVNNIASWFQIDPYILLEKTFGGSGYDIAAAQAEQAVTYQLQDKGRSVLNIDFDPPFPDKLFFVYLNQKQNSRSSIAHYRKQSRKDLQEAVDKVSGLTSSFTSCEDFQEFELLMEIHETVISRVIDIPKIKTTHFSDFKGSIKSLGGWGGDFILATGDDEAKNYFRKKGFRVVIPYSEMIL
ncbi:GHMP kinase [Antarcticibacterium sp. 1MA-6-2]|uniref:GYDIA family GHMP kinase n=1 Tax=Antarcticibacterium sp. 1MA-6-2 TaxID=2908210 RepID=UPI001F46A2A8|nr:GYDIA family GHMP kinase [Antarcticibacterium sp. 1MA-6-2]UJH89833.1 GHMP kinase [Antarcticibacterium sp. 1MA-6-2]